MRKLLLLGLLVIGVTGCGKRPEPTYYTAILKLPDDSIITGMLESYRHEEGNGRRVEVRIDGIMYNVDSTDCVLFSE